MSGDDTPPPGRAVSRDADSTEFGRRDHGFFDRQGGPRGQRDLARARSPWTGTRPRRVGASTVHDRTLGLGQVASMWPAHTPPALTRQRDVRRRATDIINELRRLPRPTPLRPTAPPAALLALLHETAAATRGQPARAQLAAIHRIAHDHHLDPSTLLGVAHGVGTLIARGLGATSDSPRTGRRAADARGRPSLDALSRANLPLALDTYLARAHLRDIAAFSDPDLPRLWMVANALRHGIPVEAILTMPATVHGPDAALQPERTDLLGWHGIRHALGDLDATVRTATEGRRWLARAGAGRGGSDAVLLALGVLHTSHPTLAAQLALRGPGNLRLADLRELGRRFPPPAHPVDLTDTALKAICDRNGWLLGTPDERHHREVVERALPAAMTDEVRTRLAHGDGTALADALHRVAPSDVDLDARTFRWDPAAADATQVRQLLGEASREAHAQFAGWPITPHPSRAVAFLVRFPDRVLRRALVVDPERLRLPATPRAGPHPTPPSPQVSSAAPLDRPESAPVDDIRRTPPRAAVDITPLELRPWPGPAPPAL
ncbi:conserved hypothetical protein [Frankia canadensis]|uniref:Uncharacterized protein n=1 Tax=Frankia canadensis TaxID=1836972 RepID=A0A2I2KVN9_9ACTN|nr:hypothetical protein [Frankia canadensis]SNQ49722.1 conserved hypothetical protein [Frankia canadensis]SOU57012.1 conserved hypothetical protein [Frankia canadensis]